MRIVMHLLVVCGRLAMVAPWVASVSRSRPRAHVVAKLSEKAPAILRTAACDRTGTLVDELDHGPRRTDGPFELVMVALFRIAFGQAIGWQPSTPLWHYDGLVDMSRKLFRTLSSPAERRARVADLFRAFPGPCDSRTPFSLQLLRNNRFCNEALAVLTARLFPFLVGDCSVAEWQRGDGEVWRTNVTIERCRFLEASSCKGMCTGLCKEPSEAYFRSIGLPVSLTPNFEDGSCAMVWGRTPEDDDLAAADLSCYRTCGLLRASTPPSGASAAAPTVAVASSSLPLYSPEARRPKPSRAAPLKLCTNEPTHAPPSAAAAAERTRREARVDVLPAGVKGQGCFAAEPIAAGTWICSYMGGGPYGERGLVSLLDTTKRYSESEPEYLFQLTPELYLDAMDSRHFSRFFNHHQNGTLDFTVDAAARRVDFFAAREIELGEELSFDYGESYWAGSAYPPAAETDSRSFALPRETREPQNPPPLTPTSSSSEIDRTVALPESEARAALLRCLEYFGATRVSGAQGEVRLRIPLGVGATAQTQDIIADMEPIVTLERAARQCIGEAQQAAVAAAE
jgi:hypothetical protein